MIGVLGRYLDCGWFFSCLVSRAGWEERSTVGIGAAQFKLSKLTHNCSSVWPSSRQ